MLALKDYLKSKYLILLKTGLVYFCWIEHVLPNTLKGQGACLITGTSTKTAPPSMIFSGIDIRLVIEHAPFLLTPIRVYSPVSLWPSLIKRILHWWVRSSLVCDYARWRWWCAVFRKNIKNLCESHVSYPEFLLKCLFHRRAGFVPANTVIANDFSNRRIIGGERSGAHQQTVNDV